jgi:hypothetical protein
MKKELQTIELTIKDELKEGVFAISLVDKPAIEEDFIMLNALEVELKVINEEKREVVGLALVPNKKILRRKDDTEFYIEFSEATIEKVQELYLKNLRANNVTIDHEKPVNGVSLIESWIVEDPKNDKSNIYGLNAVKGSWVVKMKIYNDEVYEGVKLGKFNGFSIEGMFDGLDQLQMSEEDNKEELIDLIKDLINEFKL